MGSKSEALQNIQKRYQFNLIQKGDQPHLPILKKYGEECESIIEVGFRGGVSASAFLASNPKSFITIDWDRPPFEVDRLALNAMQNQCNEAGIYFQFVREDILKVDVPECDLLFLDGFHTYEHVLLELHKHQHVVNKFILLHDTDEPSCPGMFPAVEDFLLDHQQWILEARHRNRPGLTVLKRNENVSRYFVNYPRVLLQILEHAVNRQKEMYYSQSDEIKPSNWDRYIFEEQIRYSDPVRWPLTNKKIGATEMMEAYLNQAHQKES